jgi:hypothetical protein
MVQAESSSQFTIIGNPQQKESYLITSSQQRCCIWITHDGTRHLAEIKKFDPKEKRLDIQADEETFKRFLDEIYTQASQKVFFSISHFKAQLFFSTKFRGRFGSELQFDEPPILYEVQRRANERYYCFENKNPFLLTLSGATKKIVHDVSTSGLSFVFSAEDPEAYLFENSACFNDARLELKKRIVLIDLKILYIKPFVSTVASKHDRKAGGQLKTNSELDQKFIESVVLEGNEKHFIDLFRFF